MCSLSEPTAQVKREKVKEAYRRAIDAYRRYSVFRIAISKKGIGCFDCFVIPRDHDLPRGLNPAAFNFCISVKHHFKATPEHILDQIEKWYL